VGLLSVLFLFFKGYFHWLCGLRNGWGGWVEFYRVALAHPGPGLRGLELSQNLCSAKICVQLKSGTQKPPLS
jgi:hypothetical protein